MAQIIAFINQKGGVGKTTSAVNTASYLSDMGKFVLLVDLDPQGNASSGLGIDPRTVQHSLYSTMVGGGSVREAIVTTGVDGLHLIPATADLAAANIDLVEMDNREFRLYDVLRQVRMDYDYIIIDSPPSLGLLTINALTAADTVLIPLQCEYLALRSLGTLLKTIMRVRARLNPDLEVAGILGTMYQTGTRRAEEVLGQARSLFGQRVFDIYIKKSIRFAEASALGKSILEYAPDHEGAHAYRTLAEVIIHDYNQE